MIDGLFSLTLTKTMHFQRSLGFSTRHVDNPLKTMWIANFQNQKSRSLALCLFFRQYKFFIIFSMLGILMLSNSRFL